MFFTTRTINKIMIVVIFTLGLIWCGTKLMSAAKNLEQASIERMAEIDSIFDRK